MDDSMVQLKAFDAMEQVINIAFDMIQSFDEMKYLMSVKLHYLDCHLNRLHIIMVCGQTSMERDTIRKFYNIKKNLKNQIGLTCCLTICGGGNT
ncbi:hypothetical protein A3Q56_04593 [Intoshia linei]|uniref:Uncharacterized protein n=1 Tax=Intoshia linei TaxID=1819745 RepID=A0A177B082_9BILA|nr:hypothetical protein A3Q56_04593 [Intoshia linei]